MLFVIFLTNHFASSTGTIRSRSWYLCFKLSKSDFRDICKQGLLEQAVKFRGLHRNLCKKVCLTWQWAVWRQFLLFAENPRQKQTVLRPCWHPTDFYRTKRNPIRQSRQNCFILDKVQAQSFYSVLCYSCKSKMNSPSYNFFLISHSFRLMLLLYNNYNMSRRLHILEQVAAAAAKADGVDPSVTAALLDR